MSRYISIGEASEFLGVSISTLRRWEKSGRIVPEERTLGGQRRYDLTKLRPELFHRRKPTERRTIAYGRVSSHDQKKDLERQKELLELYCSANGWQFEIVTDLGSGMNYKKKSLPKTYWK
jgi:putative resolvase